MKHVKAISRNPRAAESYSLTQILEMAIAIIEAVESVLNKDDSTTA